MVPINIWFMCSVVTNELVLAPGVKRVIFTPESFLILFVMMLGVYWMLSVRNTLFYDTICLLLVIATITLNRRDIISIGFALFAAMVALVYKNQAVLSSFNAKVDYCISQGSLVDRYNMYPNKTKTNVATVARLNRKLIYC